MACPACGFTNPEAARYCGSCGVALDAGCRGCRQPVARGLRFCTTCGEPVEGGGEPAQSSEQRSSAERRRVSVLFGDVVGFTAFAERLDPEEIRAVQSRYFEAARTVVAAHGGTIEKFIGDAVMAVWGAPTAHEDDADRAVRAGLALVDAVGQLGGVASGAPLTARAAITTGQAAVTVGAIGQGMVSGDLVNTAARLQGHAPSGGLLVDAATRALAGEAAGYEPIGEVELRGRTEPIQAFRAVARRAPRPGRGSGSHDGPFVGRDQELRELIGLFDAVVAERRSRLVSITGVAGIGKSRLAWELGEHLERMPAPVAWHAGRAPAYGDQVTFAALAEMVRRRARIPDDAPPELVRRQLTSALVELVRDDAERTWMEPRVAALLEAHAAERFERDELFAAWRRTFERVADRTPTVLVFEDLQWADASLLDFIEHLATWSRDQPILVLALARPELTERRPSWGTTISHFTSMALERLPDAPMAQLLRSRVPDLREPTLGRVLAHAGGVPLYAVELARMLTARDGSATEPERRSAGRPARDTAPVPDSLHGLLAARIDSLPAAERRLVLAGAVLGRRFSMDALVEAMGEPAEATRAALEGLIRREILSIDDEPASPARGEVAFVQDLVREVAYQTLALNERRTLHLAAARHLESRPEDDVAELLAGHLVEAHELSPEHPDARRIARRAVAALRRAAHNALHLHVPERALGHLEHALRLTDKPDQRAVVLAEAANASRAASRLDLAEGHLRELVSLHEAAGRRHETARARAHLASALLMAQRNEPAIAELESALRANRNVEADPSGVELASQLARARMLVGDERAALEWAERALRAARRLGLGPLAADILITRGTARFRLGEQEAGLADLRRAIDEARQGGFLSAELRARNNLAWLVVTDDPRTTMETAREAVALASSMGIGDIAVQLAEVATAVAVETGDWDWALEIIGEFERGVVPLANRLSLASTATIIRSLRGDEHPVLALEALEPAPPDTDRQVLAAVQYAHAWERLCAGAFAEAEELARRAADASLAAERHQHLALATRASLWQRNADRARDALDELTAMGIDGRAAAAERSALALGLGLLTGEADEETRRVAADALRELDLPLQRALAGLDAAILSGTPPDPETHGMIERLGADGLGRLADELGVSAPAGGGPRPRAESHPPTARTASPTGEDRRRQPARGPRARRG